MQIPFLSKLQKTCFHNAPVSQKIEFIVMTVLIFTMLIIFIINTWFAVNDSLSHTREDLQVFANVVSQNLEGPLAFKDVKGAADVLSSLQANSGLVYADVRIPDGEILAQYTPSNINVHHDGWLQMIPVQRNLVTSQPIVVNNQTLGILNIKLSLDSMWMLLFQQIVRMVAIALFALLIAMLLVKKLAVIFVAPIKNIAKFAGNIKRNGDYSIRVRKDSNDEVGQLADEFNTMLEAITQRDLALKESEFLWKFAIEGARDGVWDWDIEADLTQYSTRWKDMLGYSNEDILPANSEWALRIHPIDQSYVKASMQDYLEGKSDIYMVEYRLRCKDDNYKWMLSRGMIVGRSESGRPQRMIGTHTDITERKQAEQNLRVAATAFETQEGMIVTDVNKVILRVNNAFIKITGYSAEEAVGQTPRLLKSGQHDSQFYAAIWQSINSTGAWEGEIWNRRKSGEVYPEHLTITAVKNDADIISNYVATLTDITASKAASEEIKNLAYYDPLTQLPNRRLLIERLKQALAANTRSGQLGALLFLDLDYFKDLNDTLGHDVGDLLLQQVAKRLSGCVRECDAVARIGGDEFVVLLEGLSEQKLEAAAQTEVVANKILSTLNQVYQLVTHEYHISPSIGITLFSDHDMEMEELLKQADIAMYDAKKAGRNTLCFFDPQMQEVINARAEMAHDLRLALERQEFQLYYQVQVDDKGLALGAEVLIRWLHPERGMISPFNFIPLAEETGLILPIGQWVLDTACAQIKVWQQSPLARDLVLAVNVSAKQFFQVDFVEQVFATIQRHDIKPSLLKLELTESMLVDNINHIITKMEALSQIGIRFSLDDFGTGYSSLQYIKKLPLNQLKIDQSFVRDIVTDASDRTIVRTIITMAHSLGINVIAEGVETEEQRQYLFDNACTHYQGYLFSKPLPIGEFEVLLSKP